MASSSMNNSFTPKELKTPNKDLPGISKLVFTHISTLHGLISDWTRVCEKGTKICKAVQALKLHECLDDYYPRQLGPLMETLLSAVSSLKDVVDGMETVNRQLKAVAKLQPGDQPVMYTWSARRMSLEVDRLYRLALQEYRLKLTVTENLAHCRDEPLIEVYVSSWELQPYFSARAAASLFADVGLSGVT